MTRTVTALYDTRAEAEAARDRLSAEIDVEGQARIIDKDTMEGKEGSSDFHSVPLTAEDRHTYGEGIRRGGFMLCAEVDEDEDADRVVSLLEQTSSVDMDEREAGWRAEGWQPQAAAMQGSQTRDRENMGSQETGRVVEEEHIPIVEETLQVGKRQVERGGAKVRSYVRETPVNEQVTLHEENVSVERRPVDRTLSSAELDRGDLLQEREIEVRATGEEAVVAKEAHVTEEVVVRKTENDRTENIEDTVRRTEVDVDEGTDRSAMGFNRDKDLDDQRR